MEKFLRVARQVQNWLNIVQKSWNMKISVLSVKNQIRELTFSKIHNVNARPEHKLNNLKISTHIITVSHT